MIDRLIQQSILQVLTPIFDPGFSESSFGFRPKRSAHGAAKQIQQTIRSGFRWCVDMERYLTGTLKLVVNRDKSRVCRTAGVEFLGYQFHGFGGQIRVSPKSLKKFKQRAKEILTRNRGISMRQRFRELRLYLRGWIDYFVLEQRKSTTLTLDKWLRRRVRACYWSNWRLPRTRLKKLQALGVSYDEAYPPAHSGKGPWRLSMTSGVQRAMTNAWLQSQGLFTLEERWSGLAPKRRTA
ncbi:group II intron maturase-specific domain-containing protein [Stieleria magnilauensis]|uniref:group II intron maturase-specific domain-containing protein n=1 Tax=Stieleria magnilauensis TaxID=2527963 RepID=UPI003AF9A0DC